MKGGREGEGGGEGRKGTVTVAHNNADCKYGASARYEIPLESRELRRKKVENKEEKEGRNTHTHTKKTITNEQ